MTIHLYYYAIETAGIAFAVVLAVSVLRANSKHNNARVFVLLLMTVPCFFVRTRQEYGPWIPDPLRIAEGLLLLPMEVFMNAFSGLFMIYVFLMIRENQKFPRWLLVLFGFQLSLEPITVLFSREELTVVDTMVGFPVSDFLFYKLMRILQMVFASSVLYWTIIDWRADLVEGRRRLRWVFLCYQGFFGIFTGLAYTFLVPQELFIGYQVHVAIVTVISLTLFLLVIINLTLDESFIIGPLRSTEDKPEVNATDPEPDQQMEKDWEKFNESFEVGHIYREPGLSIGSLADKLSIPEYRLRKLIHERLGYRNFNVLLHEHRIREASAALSDSTQSHLPILTIALTAGYQSINPFNRAFRDLNGVTPSEYRKKALKS